MSCSATSQLKIIMASTLLMVFIASVNSVSFDLGVTFQETGYGTITFANSFTATQMEYNEGMITFTDFTWLTQTFGTLGLRTSQNTVMSVNHVTTGTVILSVSATAPGTSEVIAPNKNQPQVTGATSTTNGNKTTITIPIGYSQITLNYASTQSQTETEGNPIQDTLNTIITEISKGNQLAILASATLLIIIWFSMQPKRVQRGMRKRVKGAFK